MSQPPQEFVFSKGPVGPLPSLCATYLMTSCCTGSSLPAEAGLLLPVADWSEEDVQRWLCEEELQELVAVFRANNMDGAELILLNKETAGELGIGERESVTHAHRGLRI